MKKKIILICAYFELVIGIIFACLFIGIGIYLLLAYPEFNLLKKTMLAVGSFIVGTVVLLITLGIFEALKDLVRVEEELLEIEKNYPNLLQEKK
ncbi:MAG: hypothetical protein WC107_01845 [Patescibacteria group bacterium]